MDERAFEKAVTEQKDRVFAYASRLLRNAAEAQDVAQDALVKLWEHRARVERDGARPWLMRTAHNLCIDRIRKRRVRCEIVDGAKALAVRADHAPDPEHRAEGRAVGASILDALDALSTDDRAVLLLRDVQGLPYDEIAETLGMPLGTLKARLHRARERMRTRLSRAGVTPCRRMTT